MIKTVLLVLAGVIAAILIYAAFKSKAFGISRSTVIAVPPDRVFPLINDLQAFNRWNPFAKGDPDLKISYAPTTAGKGAAYDWVGKKSGVGRMEIADSIPAQRVTLKLDFTKPMEAHNTVNFTLEPQGTGTQVTWTMTGAAPYLHRLMSTFFNMDKMVGGQFEQGLASLKALTEKA